VELESIDREKGICSKRYCSQTYPRCDLLSKNFFAECEAAQKTRPERNKACRNDGNSELFCTKKINDDIYCKNLTDFMEFLACCCSPD
jgi:hypothetical protein